MTFSNNKLKDLLEQFRDYKKVSEITGLSYTALASRNHRSLHVPLRFWTKKKTEYLLLNFSDKRDKELAVELGCTAIQVQSKARQLKLKKSHAHLSCVLEEVSKNIASGPHRHQGLPLNFVHKNGKEHPNWIQDRSLVKGRRNKKHRFLVETKKKVLSSQQNKCNICVGELRKAEYDHILPVIIGGTSEISNCQALCPRCHFSKTQKEQEVSNNFKDLERLKRFYGL